MSKKTCFFAVMIVLIASACFGGDPIIFGNTDSPENVNFIPLQEIYQGSEHKTIDIEPQDMPPQETTDSTIVFYYDTPELLTFEEWKADRDEYRARPESQLIETDKDFYAFEKLTLLTMVKFMNEYSDSCYADSTFDPGLYTLEIGYPSDANYYDNVPASIDTVWSIPATWQHKDPTFPGFMEFMTRKVNK